MSETFLFIYINLNYLHLLIGLIYSKKYKRRKIEFSVEGKKTVKIKRI